jgi:hypothetical protein
MWNMVRSERVGLEVVHVLFTEEKWQKCIIKSYWCDLNSKGEKLEGHEQDGTQR